MHAAEAVLAVFIVVALPIRGYLTGRRLERVLGKDPAEPARTFRRSAIVKWSLTAVAVYFLVADDRFELLLVGSWLALAFPIALLIVGAAMTYRFRAEAATATDDLVEQMGSTAALLPVSSRERRSWLWVSLTAGVTEEVLYRAFLLLYLYATFAGLGMPGAAVLSGLAFGSVHLYQGVRGVVLTAVIGVVFGLLYPWSGLLVLIVVHVLFDIRVLLVPPDLARRARAAPR